MIFTRSILALFALVSFSTASAASLESLYNSFETITVSPVQIDGKSIDARSASAVCASLGYTLVQSKREKDCVYRQEILNHYAYEKNSNIGIIQMKGATAAEFNKSLKCEGGSSINVLESVVCARPKQ